MTIEAKCLCGKVYPFKDELAGQDVRCPDCGSTLRVPAKPAPAAPPADPLFDRDLFLMRQKHMSISEKYLIWDESEQPLLFARRPAHLGRGCLALLAGGAVFLAGIALAVAAAGALGDEAGGAVLLIALPIFGIAALAALLFVMPYRHVTFYRDEAMREALMTVRQENKVALTSVYSLVTPQRRVLAVFRKNYLYNLFRKRWYVHSPAGNLIAVVKEDSVILSLLRRLLGPFFGLLRTNFVILRPGDERVIGEFNRKFTLLDRYVLDMKQDPERKFDRRVAVALGLLLDTGERR